MSYEPREAPHDPVVQSILPPDDLEATRSNERLAHLNDMFLDIGKEGGVSDPATLERMRTGTNIRLVLNEIIELSPPLEADVHTTQLRDSYLSDLMKRRQISSVVRRRPRYLQDEESYIDSVLGKIENLIDAKTTEEALAVRQMPTLVEETVFEEGQELALEDLAGNHLYLLVDVLLKEHVERRDFIDNYRAHTKISKAIGNRTLRLGIAGGIFLASLSPKLGVIPRSTDVVSEDIDTGLTVLSGAIFGLELPEQIHSTYLDKIHNKRTKELEEQLAEDEHLSDLALRMTYSSTRYGGPDDKDVVTGRSGTADKEKNMARFEQLDKVFSHLSNDPGGKPYTGSQALGYAARLLIERRKQLQDIVDAQTEPSEKQALFMTLAREMLEEDLARMKVGLASTHFRKTIVRGIAVLPAIFAPSYVSAVNEASTISHDTVGALNNGPDLEEDYDQ